MTFEPGQKVEIVSLTNITRPDCLFKLWIWKKDENPVPRIVMTWNQGTVIRNHGGIILVGRDSFGHGLDKINVWPDELKLIPSFKFPCPCPNLEKSEWVCEDCGKKYPTTILSDFEINPIDCMTLESIQDIINSFDSISTCANCSIKENKKNGSKSNHKVSRKSS